MTIQTGNHLGPYEILSAIGAGGMGEVYRARDGKLGRDVAIKVLPEEFARDAERMARFQREAKLLASLNHPNIASIYGLEDSGATHALVMELVEGSTLADRIRQGPIPIDEALPIAKQIAEGLEYAHERGIVHRDLKPSNVKVTADDAVKILDFGLAKTMQAEAAFGDATTSPTISEMATRSGVLLGTAAYMSPEQARGKLVDRRADIWAFGCVLYEMLTGKMVFGGGTVTDTLAAVLKSEPDWSQLPAGTPTRNRVLLQRCLQKDAKQRLRDIGDARISIDEVLSGASDPISLSGDKPPALAGLMQLEITVHEKVASPARPTPTFAMSPDGRHLAFAGIGSDSVLRLWIRSLDRLEARPLYGSESAVLPPFFWSPDSKFIVFDGGGKLKKIGIVGGPAQTLCEVDGTVVGGSWNRDGIIIIGSASRGIMRVLADGGAASPVTNLDPSRKETWHVQPSFLPDGRHFIYLRGSDLTKNRGIYIGSLDVKPDEQSSKRLVPTNLGAVFAPPTDTDIGQLLFERDGMLMAQPFDTAKLELAGEPTPISMQVGFALSFGFFSASANGVLICRAGEGASPLTWLDQRGKRLGTAGASGTYVTLSLSPDGNRAVASRHDQNSLLALWLVDFLRGTNTRFTFGNTTAPLGVWSPDGNRVVFASGAPGRYDLYQKLASGARDAELLLASAQGTLPTYTLPTSWSRDGRFLRYMTGGSLGTKRELWLLPFEGDKKPVPFLRTQFNNGEGQFSPDGCFVAYVSDESGRDEVYIRTFSPGSGEAVADDEGRWLISTGGGNEPRWSGDGKVLYYIALDGKLMAVDIATAPVFRAGVPKALFETSGTAGSWAFRQSWDVTRDGKRFLFMVQAEQGTSPFRVLLNWQAGLKK